MSQQRTDQIKQEAAAAGRDPRTRKIMLALAIVATLAMAATVAAVYFGWSDSQDEAEAGQDLAGLVRQACEDDQIDTEDLRSLCESAVKVERGEPGPIGPQGDEGPPGITGEQGIPGTQGATGSQGPRGVPGPKGDTGNRGGFGAVGEDGSDGADGSDGVNGADGEQGPPGSPGEQGPPGPTGEQGQMGPQGPQGQSAFPFAFTFTIPGEPPLQEDRTYTVTCTLEGCTVQQA